MFVGLSKIPVSHLRAMCSMVTLELCDACLVVPRHCICGLQKTHLYVCWTVPDTCTTSPSNAFYGDLGALRCLSTGFGDIAFVDFSRLTSMYLVI